MVILLSNKKYTVYDDGGKVVIIGSDKGVCIAYANSIKG